MVVVSVLPRSILAGVIVVSISLLLLVLDVAKVGVQPVEAVLPMSAVLADPVGDVSQPSRLQLSWLPLRLASPLDKSGPLQHPKVLRDGGLADVERLGQILDRCLALGEPGQDR